MKKIAIISYNIYPYLYMPELKIAGGAELQLATLAKHLSQRGFQVVFFTGDFGQDVIVKKDDYTFYKLEENGTGKVRKISHFLRLIKKVKPDFLLERGTSTFTFLAVLFSKFFGIPFVFCGASDINFAKDEVDPFFGGSKLKQRLYQWSLYFITHIVVQKNRQALLLNSNYGISKNVTLIRNFPPDISPVYRKESSESEGFEYDAVWVANLIPYKQPELFIELAKNHPRHKFLLIGTSSDTTYREKIQEMASTVTNLNAIGYIPPTEIIQWMRKSRISVNTTSVASGHEEGFSNVQLMGWMYGMPSLTLISDPDNLIVTNQMGFRSGSFSQMCDDFKTLIEDKGLYQQMSNNATLYVTENHNEELLVQNYLSILNQN